MLTHSESLQNRRNKLFEIMESSSTFLLFSNQTVKRNVDVEYPFRQDSGFYYLTGIDEPNSVYFLKKDEDGNRQEVLFIQEKNQQEQIWTGATLSKEKSRQISQIEIIFNFEELFENLHVNLKNTQTIYFDPKGSYQPLRDKVVNLIFEDNRPGFQNLDKLQKTNSLLRNLRMLKDTYEVAQMEKSAQIAIQGHIQAVKNMYQKVKNSQKIWEYQVCADLYNYFASQNCTWSYQAIVASGSNACVLHYTANNQELKAGDLLLIDAGSEYNYYASDITRCYPICGKFSEAQKIIYNLVLKANLACIAEIAKAGSTYTSYNQVSINILTEGLISLGILQGSIEENIAQKNYFKYYMHGVGHWLGLDVHDAGIYIEKGQRSDIELTNGMILTVEPGLYFDKDDQSVPTEFRGIGIRIEDDILKTQNGAKNLTQNMPKTITEIENLFEF